MLLCSSWSKKTLSVCLLSMYPSPFSLYLSLYLSFKNHLYVCLLSMRIYVSCLSITCLWVQASIDLSSVCVPVLDINHLYMHQSVVCVLSLHPSRICNLSLCHIYLPHTHGTHMYYLTHMLGYTGLHICTTATYNKGIWACASRTQPSSSSAGPQVDLSPGEACSQSVPLCHTHSPRGDGCTLWLSLLNCRMVIRLWGKPATGWSQKGDSEG